MSTATATATVPLPLSSHHSSRLAAAYLPSPSSDDDDNDDDAAIADTASLTGEPLDSPDDWSDDCPDSADEYGHTSDSDDSSLAWNTSKSKKHSHSHSHSHAHVHHKKTSFHPASDHLAFFVALRKSFCSRSLDQRIEVCKAQKRAENSSVTGGGESVPREKKRVRKAGTNGGVSGRHGFEDGVGASSFGAMFKCSVTDTPKNLLKRASFSEISDEQDVNAHRADAENFSERSATERYEFTRQKAEREEVLQVTLNLLERDGKGPSKKLTNGSPLTNNICKDMTHKEYGEAHVESGTNAPPNKSKLSDDNLDLMEDDQSSNHSKASEKRVCSREFDLKAPLNKGDRKHAMPVADALNKSSKNQNQVGLVNTLELKEKGGLSLENNAMQHSKDLQGKKFLSKGKPDEAAEIAEVSTSSEKRETQTEALADKTKSQDVPLHIYIKEKHPPEVVVKDSKRKSKAKKVKVSKGKKVLLFEDGIAPSATEAAADAESTLSVLDRQSESINKVQSPNAAVNNKIPKAVASASATVDMPSIIGNAMEVVDGVNVREVRGQVATSTKPSATPVRSNKNVGNPVSNDPGPDIDAALAGSLPKVTALSLAIHQNVEDGVAKMSFTEGRHAAQPEAQSSGSFEENSTRFLNTSLPSPTQKLSGRWFPPLDVALRDPISGPELASTLNGSLVMPQPSVSNSLATSTITYSPTALSHESEFNVGNTQGNSVPTGNIFGSDFSNPSSSAGAPLASYHFGQRFAPPAVVSSGRRMLATDTSNAQFSRLKQVPVSLSQAYAPSSVPTLQQEISPPLFHTDSRASGNSSWIQPENNSGPGFPFSMVPTTTIFGEVIGCVNQTLSMYKQMKSFSIEAKYLVNVPNIVPGCCKLFLFNIEKKQLHGVYVSSSLQAMPVNHDNPVAFDCIENYSIPLSVDELDTVLPEARRMNNRPLFLEPYVVEQLVTLFERKNKPRLSWVPSTTNAVPVSSVHGLLELRAGSSEFSSIQDHLVEAMGQGTSVISASPASMTINEAAKDSRSPLSCSPRAKVPESAQPFAAQEIDLLSAPAQVFPLPDSSTNIGELAKSVWSEAAQVGFTRKLPEQGVAPSPMALWPHLFPKASPADSMKENFMHMETREKNNTPNYYASAWEKNDMGGRPDSESEALSFSQLPESGVRSAAHRPKLSYNPLAVEQGRQRQLFDSSKTSNWSTLVPELDLQQPLQYSNRSRSQDNQYMSSLKSEQLKMNYNSGGAASQLSASTATQLPLHYQMEHALPDSLRSDLGLSQTSTSWSEEPLSMHLSTNSSEIATGAVNLDRTNLCCYCFTRRADHLIIDCQHLGPCLECAATKKIEYCGQLNCQTKVTQLLRLFR